MSKRSRTFPLRLIALVTRAALSIVAASRAAAQQSEGSIRGRITDSAHFGVAAAAASAPFPARASAILSAAEDPHTHIIPMPIPCRAARRIAALVAFTPLLAWSQALEPRDLVAAALAPKNPLPPESASAAVTRFSFVAYGDTRGRHDGIDLQAEHRLVIESMIGTIKKSMSGADPIRFVLQSGDAVQNGSEGLQWTVSYVPLINRLTQGAGVPYFPSVGNHDVGNATDLSDHRRVDGLRNYGAANLNLIPADGSPRRLNGYPTFAFGYGNTFFVAFDSDIPDDSIQFAWVKAQLEGLDRKRFVNTVLFFHHPPFSSGPQGGAKLERQAASIRSRWIPLIRKNHVKLLLTGHEHLFEHWVERYTDASGQHRVDEIVSGGGGAPLYGYTGEPDLRDYLAAGSAEKVTLEHLARPSSDPGANPFHYVVVHVDNNTLSVDVVPVDWGREFAPYRSNKASMVDPTP